MALSSSGQLSLGDINVELGRNRTDETSMADQHDGTYATINTGNDSADRPDGSAPHQMSEFYSYDHSAASLPANARPYIWAEDWHRPTSWHNVSNKNTDTAGDTYDTTGWQNSSNTTFGTEGTADAAGNYSVERVAYEADLTYYTTVKTNNTNYLNGTYYISNPARTIRYGPNEGFPAQTGFTDSLRVQWKAGEGARNYRYAHMAFELGQDTSDTSSDHYADCDHLVIGYCYRGGRYKMGVGKYINSTSTLTWLTIDGGSSTNYSHGNDECELYWKPSRSSAPYMEVYIDNDIGTGTPTFTYSDSFLASSSNDDVYGVRIYTSGGKHRYSGTSLYYATAAMTS